MLYNTVRIIPLENEWTVEFDEIEGDREEGDESINTLGVYHYPRKMGKKKVFEKLKNLMVEKHKEKIKKLLLSQKKLEGLEGEVKNADNKRKKL